MGLNKRLFIQEGISLPDFEFKAVTYSGNGGTNAITGVGFQPDLVFTKWRSGSTQRNSCIYDVIRGTTNILAAETTGQNGSVSGSLTSFDSDGFTLGSWVGNNQSGSNWVSWNFKAGGTATSNTNGSITSSVSASNGFSIVSYSGNNQSSGTIGHGLAQPPELVITKALNLTAGWPTMAPTSYYGLRLNETGANDNTGLGSVFYNNTAPTNKVYTVGGSDEVNDSYNYISYCFHSVTGKIDVGTYSGTGAVNNVITTGFQPSMVIIRGTHSAGWRIYDSTRGTDKSLRLNTFAAEYDDTSNYLEFESTGFAFRTGNTGITNSDLNGNGNTYIYIAFA